MRLVRHDPVVATTDGMKRGGYYDEHSEYQEKVAESGSGLVRACVDAVPLPGGGETFVVADYGASTGKNSIAAVRNAIDQVRTRRAGQPAVALHNDLATNDWNEFFTSLRAACDAYPQRAGQGMNVLAIQRRHENGLQQRHRIVRDAIGFVLQIVDAFHARRTG